MTKRAKLSLDPQQRSKPAPPHGFAGQAAPPPDAGAVHPGAAAPAKGSTAEAGQAAGPAAGRAAGHWRANRPEPEPAQAAAVAEDQPAGGGIGAWVAGVRVLARKPVVRAVAVGMLAGLSFYLLRRRLF
jgi:hypothetical protein